MPVAPARSGRAGRGPPLAPASILVACCILGCVVHRAAGDHIRSATLHWSSDGSRTIQLTLKASWVRSHFDSVERGCFNPENGGADAGSSCTLVDDDGVVRP